MLTYVIWFTIAVSIVGAITWAWKSSKVAAAKIAQQEIIHEAREEVIEDIAHAKDVREKLSTNNDPDWAKRVQDKYRRR